MKPVSRIRGRPLVALLAVLGFWVAGRAALWDIPQLSSGRAPLALADRGGAVPPAMKPDRAIRGWNRPGSISAPQVASGSDGGQPGLARPERQRTPQQPRWRSSAFPPVWTGIHADPGHRQAGEVAWLPTERTSYRTGSASIYDDGLAPRPTPVQVAAAHQMLWMAGLSRTSFPIGSFAGGGGTATPASFDGRLGRSGGRKRWSADSWLLLRRGGDVPLASGVAPGTYGASQMGAVLRYSLAPESGRRPTAFVRTTAALNESRESEIALGVSVRPLAALPVAAAAELRATRQAGFTRARPALLAWTEIPPVPIPFAATAEVYAQAGYVGGKFSTPFADGQIRLERGVGKLLQADLRAGGGAWAGAQKGASRMDIGPTATLGLPVGQSASARLALDWRFRVAGDAQPGSGPALTLSAGF